MKPHHRRLRVWAALCRALRARRRRMMCADEVKRPFLRETRAPVSSGVRFTYSNPNLRHLRMGGHSEMGAMTLTLYPSPLWRGT